MSRLSKIIFACIVLVLTSCKTLKVDANSNLTKKSSVKEVVAIHNAKNFKYNTLQSRVKTTYDDGKKAVSPSITLRMEKGKKIWLSAKFLGFTVAKIYITPTNFSFYEKLNRRYYSGDLSVLEKFLGQTVNFEQIQNLFLGQSILDINSKEFESSGVVSNKVVLHSKNIKNNWAIKMLFFVLNAKVSAYEISKNNKQLEVSYSSYQKVNGQDFPEFMQIQATNKNTTRLVKMNFRSVTIDEKLSFPYTVPKGYTKFKFKK